MATAGGGGGATRRTGDFGGNRGRDGDSSPWQGGGEKGENQAQGYQDIIMGVGKSRDFVYHTIRRASSADWVQTPPQARI